MKKGILIFFYFLFSCLSSSGQPARLGVVMDSREAELRTTDQKNGNRFFTGFPITLKKGMGAVFFMQSSAFSPNIFLFTTDYKNPIGSPYLKKRDGIPTAGVAFTATTDTSFLVILTSEKENQTGAFKYGYYLMDSTQMSFKQSYSTCEKLIYFFNHWQIHWDLISREKKTHIDKEDPESFYEYFSVTTTFTSLGSGKLTDHYEEVMYSKQELLGLVDKGKPNGRDFYNKICEEIKACLDMKAWKIETEQNQEPPSSITHFMPANCVKDEKQKTFKVILKFGGLAGFTEVILVFN